MDYNVLERMATRLPADRWRLLRHSLERDAAEAAAHLSSAAQAVRRHLSADRGTRLQVGPEPLQELTIAGEDIADELAAPARELVNECREVVTRNGLAVTDIAAVVLTGAAGDTQCLVDAARTAFGFDVVRVDPALADPTPLPGQSEVILEREVSRQRFTVTTDGVTLGDRHIRYKDVDGVGYKHYTETAIGVTSLVNRTWAVRAGDTTIEVHLDRTGWSGRKGRQTDEGDWQTLVAVARKLIEPRLLDDLIAQLRGGRPVQVGSLTIAQNSISRRKLLRQVDYLTWDGYAGTDLENGVIYIKQRTAKGGARNFANLPISEFNAVLLPDLLRIAARLFK